MKSMRIWKGNCNKFRSNQSKRKRIRSVGKTIMKYWRNLWIVNLVCRSQFDKTRSLGPEESINRVKECILEPREKLWMKKKANFIDIYKFSMVMSKHPYSIWNNPILSVKIRSFYHSKNKLNNCKDSCNSVLRKRKKCRIFHKC